MIFFDNISFFVNSPLRSFIKCDLIKKKVLVRSSSEKLIIFNLCVSSLIFSIQLEKMITEDIGVIKTEDLHGKAKANEFKLIKNWIKLNIIGQNPKIEKKIKNLLLFFIKYNE